jgi:HD-GYP domain-containing protein (c-di-GMP phosphodiesterase class II)
MSAEQSDARGEARQTFYAKQQLIASAKGAFQQLSAVMRSAALYPAAHPFLLSSADQLLSRTHDLLATRKEVAFYIVSGELFFETYSVPIDQGISLLLEDLIRRDVGGVIFKPALTRDEVVKFAGLMNQDVPSSSSEWMIGNALTAEGVVNIELRRVRLVDKKAGETLKQAKKKSAELFMEAVTTVKEMVDAVHLDKAINMRAMTQMVHTMVDNILDNRDAILGLTSIKMYDEYTFAHSVNTSILAVSLGTYLSLDKPQIAALGVAGLLHDIGKVAIPREIINKPEKLTDQEWGILKRHPVEGALLLADAPAVTRIAMIAAFEHHQHSGEHGYPRIDDMLLQHPFSQIIALADAYDAITAARVYYSIQTPPDKAIRILINKRGKSFNPVLVKAFVNMIGIFPIGTLVKLSTGAIGLVVHQTRDLMRPRVLLLNKFDGSEKENGVEVNLLETERGRYKYSIVGTINPFLARINVKKYLE